MAVDHPPTAPVVEATADEFTRTVENNTAEAMTHCSAHEVPTANFVEDVTSISDATEIATSRKENETCQGENGQEVEPLLVVTASSNTRMLQNGMSDLDVNRNLNQCELEGEKLRDRAGDQRKDSKGVCRCK